MNISIVSYHTVDIKHGGPRTQILQTKKHLEKLGLRVQLYDIWNDNNQFRKTDIFHIFSSNFGVFDFARFVNSEKKKFVVSPIFFTRQSPLSIKFVIKSNEVINNFVPGIWTDYNVSKKICQWSDKVLPNTDKEKLLIKNGLGVKNSKIEIIPNGVEKRFLEADPKIFINKYGIKDFILNVGHIGVERKNTLTLIKALSKIDHPAVIIGKIYNTSEGLSCIKEAKKNKNLIIIDGLDHNSKMLESAYAASKVFVLPAKYETPGIAGLEAGLAGSKIVITKYGGTKYYFNKFATYINPYSIKNIKNAIEKNLEISKSNELSDHIKNNFLWEKVAEKTASIYEKIINK